MQSSKIGAINKIGNNEIMIEDLKIYIKETLGVDLEINAINPDRLKALPVYIKGEYNIYPVKLYHQDLLFAEVKGVFTTEKLRKNIKTIKDIYNGKTGYREPLSPFYIEPPVPGR
ncbi:hypothetical protein ACFLT1_06480 [Bacteroidota bacterium]